MKYYQVITIDSICEIRLSIEKKWPTKDLVNILTKFCRLIVASDSTEAMILLENAKTTFKTNITTHP